MCYHYPLSAHAFLSAPESSLCCKADKFCATHWSILDVGALKPKNWFKVMQIHQPPCFFIPLCDIQTCDRNSSVFARQTENLSHLTVLNYFAQKYNASTKLGKGMRNSWQLGNEKVSSLFQINFMSVWTPHQWTAFPKLVVTGWQYKEHKTDSTKLPISLWFIKLFYQVMVIG